MNDQSKVNNCQLHNYQSTRPPAVSRDVCNSDRCALAVPDRTTKGIVGTLESHATRRSSTARRGATRPGASSPTCFFIRGPPRPPPPVPLLSLLTHYTTTKYSPPTRFCILLTWSCTNALVIRLTLLFCFTLATRIFSLTASSNF